MLNLKPQLTLNEHYNILESVHFDLTHLKGLSATQICGAYVANLLSALVLLRAKDAQVRRILSDTTGYSLTAYKTNMNPINIWGLAIRKPQNKQFKDIISDDVAKELDHINGRILKGTFAEIHRPLSSHSHMIAWKDMMEAVGIMLVRLSMKNVKTTIISKTIEDWDASDNDDRGAAIAYAFHLLLQYDANSPLVARLHTVASSNMLNSSDIIDKDGKVVNPEQKDTLKEDEGAVAEPTASATTASDISSVPKKFFNGKLIHRVKRTFKPKSIKDKTKKKPDSGGEKPLV